MTQEKKSNYLTVHLDDAKDKVFATVLNVLIKLGNTPSSPKELAKTIIKHKLKTLGGQTPFATISSQHFKRAAEPHLAKSTKHITQLHAKKISHLLTTEEPSNKMLSIVNNNNTFIPITTKKLKSFKITKILIGNMKCYQLDDDDDEIKVLRFIESTKPDKQIKCLKKGYINATHLRKAAIPVLGEGTFDTEKESVVMITNGPTESRGAWVSLHRARELIEEFEIESSAGLSKLLSDNPIDDVYKTEKKPRKIAPSMKHMNTFEILKSLNISTTVQPNLYQFPLLMNNNLLPTIIYPLQPTNPPMTITLLDHVVVCTALLKRQEYGIEKEYQLMRRLDNGFINGTQLLIAGGIDTERERSMILSFESSRVRIPNKQSNLFGTWIPSRRAQELAATCSIQHALNDFLDEDIESLFPTLPIISRRSQHKLPTDKIKNEHVVTQLLNPNNTLKMVEINHTSHAPLLGSFTNTDNDKSIISINTSCSNNEPNESTDEETDTDNEVELIRKEIRQMRDTAIAAMEIGNSMQMNDLFENQSNYHLQSKQYRRKKRKMKKNKESINVQYAKNRYSTGGKWATTNIEKKRKKCIKKKKELLLTHTVVNEQEEDEDVDIGGTDCDDDLR